MEMTTKMENNQKKKYLKVTKKKRLRVKERRKERMKKENIK